MSECAVTFKNHLLESANIQWSDSKRKILRCQIVHQVFKDVEWKRRFRCVISEVPDGSCTASHIGMHINHPCGFNILNLKRSCIKRKI